MLILKRLAAVGLCVAVLAAAAGSPAQAATSHKKMHRHHHLSRHHHMMRHHKAHRMGHHAKKSSM